MRSLVSTAVLDGDRNLRGFPYPQRSKPKTIGLAFNAQQFGAVWKMICGTLWPFYQGDSTSIFHQFIPTQPVQLRYMLYAVQIKVTNGALSSGFITPFYEILLAQRKSGTRCHILCAQELGQCRHKSGLPRSHWCLNRYYIAPSDVLPKSFSSFAHLGHTIGL